MKTIKDYRDLYLKCNVLSLADVFEKFRNNSLKNCGLCPSRYLNAPVLSSDVMLKMTKIKLEFIPDPDLYIFYEESARGEISYISNRYSKAKSKCLKSFDPTQESKYIIYLNANNSCACAVSKFLLADGFKCIDPKEFDLNKYTIISLKGRVLKLILNIQNNYAHYTMTTL